MQKLFFILLSLISIEAAAYDYKSYWNRNQFTTAELNYDLYLKNSPVAYLQNIASLMVTENSQASQEAVVMFYRKVVGPKKWTHEKHDGLEIYETVDPISTTLYRLAFNPKTNQYAVGAVKTRFLLPSYLELHLLQVQKLTGHAATATNWQNLYQKFIPEAQADTTSPFTLTSLINSTAPTSITGTQILGDLNGLTTSVDNATGALKGLSPSVAALPPALNNTAAGANNLAGALRGATPGLNALPASVTNAVGGLKQTGRQLGSDIKTAANTVQTTFSPQNAAALAAAATLSGILVGATATIVANGTWEMAQRAYHELTGTFTEAQISDRLSRFQDGMKNFSTESPKLIEAEQKMTMLTAAMAATTDMTEEQTLAELDKEISEQRALVAQAGLAPTCVAQAEEATKNLSDLRKMVAATGVCQQLDGLYTTWVKAEADVALARKNIIQNYKVFMGVNAQQAYVEPAMQESRKQENACETTASKLASAKRATKEKDCAGADQNSAECRSVEALQGLADSCTSEVVYTPDSQATLVNAVKDLNSQIGHFAGGLATLDCSERDAKQNCTKLGPVAQAQVDIKKHMSDVAQACPTQTFAKSFLKPAGRSPASEDLISGAKPESSPSLLTRIVSFFKRHFGRGEDSPQKPVNEYLAAEEFHR